MPEWRGRRAKRKQAASQPGEASSVTVSCCFMACFALASEYNERARFHLKQCCLPSINLLMTPRLVFVVERKSDLFLPGGLNELTECWLVRSRKKGKYRSLKALDFCLPCRTHLEVDKQYKFYSCCSGRTSKVLQSLIFST